MVWQSTFGFPLSSQVSGHNRIMILCDKGCPHQSLCLIYPCKVKYSVWTHSIGLSIDLCRLSLSGFPSLLKERQIQLGLVFFLNDSLPLIPSLPPPLSLSLSLTHTHTLICIWGCESVSYFLIKMIEAISPEIRWEDSFTFGLESALIWLYAQTSQSNVMVNKLISLIITSSARSLKK